MFVPDTTWRRGFTLAEVVVVLVCMGLVGGLLVGGFRGVVQAGREEAAMGRARLLNAARWSYGLVAPDAQQRWGACAGDNDRFALLASARLVDGQAADFLSSPGGYVLRLDGALRDRTVLSKNGKVVGYR